MRILSHLINKEESRSAEPLEQPTLELSPPQLGAGDAASTEARHHTHSCHPSGHVCGLNLQEGGQPPEGLLEGIVTGP